MIWVFWPAAALICYAYVGYLAWLWVVAKLHPKPVKRAPVEPHVSVVMVVRNEEAAVPEKLRNLLEIDYPASRLQIVVVSDGSTDGTEAILARVRAESSSARHSQSIAARESSRIE